MLTKNYRKAKEAIKSFFSNPYAWPGGYRLIGYFEDGESICHACFVKGIRRIIRESLVEDGWNASFRFAGCDIHWEGPPEFCCECNTVMESEYGDPWAEENTEEA